MPNGSGAGAEPEKSSLEELSDEELVELFLARSKDDRRIAHLCFEIIIARYHWLINHVVRNSRFRYPAWDSADDVISRVVFKVYRGLAQWRRQGKLSSFIARIASSEMIDTIRRVGRDKSWNPRAAADPDSDELPIVETTASKEPSPEAQAVSGEQREIVDRLLSEVCRDWKDSVIVNEYIIGNQNAKEIAEKYDVSEDLVYQRARRLRVRLVKWLGERGITSAESLLGSGGKVSG
ncbi:MAG TPA: sigma-70 family RNA polymerase sigma factor [Blastocatellia bacterium]|nr:sigma-70 family RNA polymerase sigma factor [Blastocatellia bacterium]